MAANTLKHGTYVGPLGCLRGKTALLRAGPSGFWLAQFDDMSLAIDGYLLGFDWHAFDATDFEVDASE